MKKTKIEAVILIFISVCIHVCRSSDVSLTLLRIADEAGVSFKDLWNLNGHSVATESDAIYRTGLIEKPFTTNCPKKLYFILGGFSITFNEPFSDNTLSWITASSPSYISYGIGTSSVTISLPTAGEFPFKMTDNVDPAKTYALVYHPTSGAFPKMYHSPSFTPVTASIPGGEASFTSATQIKIRARYDSSCDMSDPYTPISVAQAMTILNAQPTTQEETTTTTITTTTTEEPTTVQQETTTESPTTTTFPQNNNAISTTQSSEPMCPCECDFKKRLDTLSAVSDIPIEELKIQLAPVIQEIKENLTVDASKLSSTIRQKQSASDERESASQMGVMGAVLLGFTFGMLILIDITSLPRHLLLAKRNCLGSQ